MALPTSGPLSINDIRIELGASAVNQSLGAFSDTAGFIAPDAITDFYGFSAGPTEFLVRTGFGLVCGSTTSISYYHDGTGGLPITGDIVYTNSGGTTTASTGTYPASTLGSLAGAVVILTVGGRGADPGEVVSVLLC